MGLKVLQVTGEIEDFKPSRIKNKIIAETGLSEDEAERIKNSVVSLIHKRYKEEVDTSTIRSLINNQLVKRGFIEEEDLSKKLGMSVSDITDLIENGNHDNANIMYSPEMVAKYIYDANMKSYALLSLPKELRQAHTEGYLHIHDLEYFNLRPNCFNHDIRFYGRNGLKIDGKGVMGAVANPAKSLKVILNHMLQAMMAGAMVLSGGQSFSHFNVFLAPYCKGMSYSEIKQEIQGFIYNCNMSLIGRGGQSIFSSINLEFDIPDFLKDVPAVAPSGVYQGVYGDYEEESDLVFKAVCEVLKEKDAIGRYFTFPNTLFVIREHTLDKYDWKVQLVHELLSENPTIYFMNCVNENRITMGCRTTLSNDWTGDWEKDLMNTGNFHYTTINLPLLALESEDINDFYDELGYYMDISRLILLERKRNVEHVFDLGMSDFLLQKDKETGEQLYDIKRCSFSIGLCGLNECLKQMTGKGIKDDSVDGEKIVSFMTKKINEYKQKDNLRWSLFFSPAESTAHRFAEINKKKYPKDAIVNGTKGSYYLTNSSHINVDDNATLVEHIKNANIFHKYAKAGNILHLWLGEPFPDPKSLYSLNKKIAETETKFWAYTNDYTYCRNCQHNIQLPLSKCPNCGSEDVVVMSRITGYYQPVLGYNNGKKQEFEDRYRHKLN